MTVLEMHTIYSDWETDVNGSKYTLKMYTFSKAVYFGGKILPLS
jgi:hypothetical protein